MAVGRVAVEEQLGIVLRSTMPSPSLPNIGPQWTNSQDQYTTATQLTIPEEIEKTWKPEPREGHPTRKTIASTEKLQARRNYQHQHSLTLDSRAKQARTLIASATTNLSESRTSPARRPGIAGFLTSPGESAAGGQRRIRAAGRSLTQGRDQRGKSRAEKAKRKRKTKGLPFKILHN